MTSRAWGTCLKELYIFPLLENGKDLYGISISSARWTTNELLHRLFFKRQVRLCRITLYPSLGKIGCQVHGRLLEAFSTCIVTVVTH